MKKILTLVLMVAAVSWHPVQAQTETSSKIKIAIYEACKPECIEDQKKGPENKAILDTPFIIESYCSCHCARMAMRLSQKDLDLWSRAALRGGTAQSIPGIKQITDKSFPICTKALTGN